VTTQLLAPRLKAGRDYPANDAELRAWFPDDAACLDYLEWLRWPEGFVCPQCKVAGRWRMADGRFWCIGCRRRLSVTGGTIFHRTRTPPDGLVRGCVARHFRQERGFGKNPAPAAGLRFLSDGLGHAAPLPHGHGATRP
jgi:hypothetical protein